jgi:hypothetical protein
MYVELANSSHQLQCLVGRKPKGLLDFLVSWKSDVSPAAGLEGGHSNQKKLMNVSK